MPLQSATAHISTNGGELPEVQVHAEKEHLQPLDAGEKERYVSDGLQLVPPLPNTRTVYTTQPESDSPPGSTVWKKKRLWVPLANLVFLAAIVGGIMGGLLIHRDRPSREASSSSSNSITQLIPQPSSTAEAVPRPSAKPLNSSLASVAWMNSEGLNHRRLYYQDSVGTIKESAWNSSGDEWYSSNNALGKARPNSPLAAAVAGNQTWDFQLNLYYLDINGRLVELYTKDGSSWTPGSLSFAGIVPSPDSDLAATWAQHDEPACKTVCGGQYYILAYEDSNDELWVVNVTTSGPQWTTLDADPTPGSGLAVNLQWRNFAPAGIRLYYQRREYNLVSVDWESQAGLNDTANNAGWHSHEDDPIPGMAISGAPMASFSWGVDADSGDPLLMDILTWGPEGVRVSWWGGSSDQHWQDPTNIDVMANVQARTALAANTDRRIYALEAGVVQEFDVSTEGLHWTHIGVVSTENR
ncbi:MAG: hypothetical protein Q9168_001269 [Polycauliona sp. 1 TL-2023]